MNPLTTAAAAFVNEGMSVMDANLAIKEIFGVQDTNVDPRKSLPAAAAAAKLMLFTNVGDNTLKDVTKNLAVDVYNGAARIESITAFESITALTMAALPDESEEVQKVAQMLVEDVDNTRGSPEEIAKNI